MEQDPRKQVEKELDRALRQMAEYSPRQLADKLNAEGSHGKNILVEDVETILDIVSNNRDGIKRKILTQLDSELDYSELGHSKDVDGSVSMSDVQDGEKVRVMPDGGSVFSEIFSESAVDTFHVLMVGFNAFIAGSHVSEGNYTLATLSAFALLAFLALHTKNHYDVNLDAKARR